MTTLALIHGLGSIGPFASRAFLPAFVTALLLRFGPKLAIVRDLGLLQRIGDTPGWFTADVTLWILGVLVVPLMALLSYAFYRRAFVRQLGGP